MSSTCGEYVSDMTLTGGSMLKDYSWIRNGEKVKQRLYINVSTRDSSDLYTTQSFEKGLSRDYELSTDPPQSVTVNNTGGIYEHFYSKVGAGVYSFYGGTAQFTVTNNTDSTTTTLNQTGDDEHPYKVLDININGAASITLSSKKYGGTGNVHAEWVDTALLTRHDYENGVGENYTRVTIKRQAANGITPPETVQYYNRAGQLVKEKVKDGTKTYINTNLYDKMGNLLEVKDASAYEKGLAYTVKYEYDALGNVVKEYNTEGNYVQNQYDNLGRLTAKTDYMGATINYTYDGASRLIKTETPIDSGVTNVVKSYYDGNGNAVKTKDSITSSSYNETLYEFDSMNRPVAVKQTPSSTNVYTQYKYDSLGNPLRVLTGQSSKVDVNADYDVNTANYEMTSYNYDKFGNNTAVTDPYGSSKTYTYDFSGRVTSETDRLGNVTTYTYDSKSRVTDKRVTKDDVTTFVTYTYDRFGNVLTMTDNSGTTTYTYDNFFRLLTETRNGKTKTYTYDTAGNRASFALSESGTNTLSASYGYDNMNRLTSYTSSSVSASYAYNANGALTQSVSGNVRADYTYTAGGMVKTIQQKTGDTVNETLTYTYQPSGNIYSYQRGSTNTYYGYNNCGWLTYERRGDISKSYIYDNYGNRTRKTGLNEADYSWYLEENSQYDKNNRLLSTNSIEYQGDISTDSSVTYTYDANGNQISETSLYSAPTKSGNSEAGITTFAGTTENPLFNSTINSYDGFNRLITSEKIKDGILSASSYTYDGNGLRQSKTVNGATTTHIWDGANIIGDITGTSAAYYHRGNGIIASQSTAGTTYYRFNAHGDVIRTENGATIKDYNYDAFGNQYDIDKNDANPFRYCGEYFDRETDSIYLRNRYYSPGTGRFITEDPVRDGANWYVYCGNNPVNRWDPTGRAWTDEDQAEYDRMVNAGQKKEAKAFKKEIEAPTKDWNKADGDIYKENEARYRAVVARQGAYANGYVDDFDYTRGQGAMVFEGVHQVALGQYHTSVVIMVDSSSEFWNDESFSNSAYGGKIKFATLGAGSVDGNLVSGVNRKPNDINLSIKKEMINLNISDSATIKNLFALEKYYRENNTNVPYVLLPVKSTSHNSNSFAHGLLNAAGISSTKPSHSVPGWNQPVPNWRFGK